MQLLHELAGLLDERLRLFVVPGVVVAYFLEQSFELVVELRVHQRPGRLARSPAPTCCLMAARSSSSEPKP